ncbi:MAG: pimeloyl-ACP methyl ester carboxylesterase [Verrucomicrobiales bacterium]|jgi:pimeloyl-ACP methyl ester carboxylesterase
MTGSTTIAGSAGTIAIHDLGGNGEYTLLVCHATGFLGQVYRAFAAELSDDARVVALDFRGHGDSDTPAELHDFRWSAMVDDLRRVIDHIDASTLHGFGHSLGGAVLLEMERLHPGTFATAMVFEPVVPPGSFSDGPLIAAARGRLKRFPSRAAALLRYAARPPLGLFRADVLHAYVRHGFADDGEDGGILLKCSPESEANTYLNAGEIHLGLLDQIALDVVVAVSGDGGFPAQLAPQVADALPNGRLLEFPTLTHFGPLQDPVAVANAMRELLKTPTP